MARKLHYRNVKESLLIVVEGETELIYFNQLKADCRLAHISVEPKLSPRKDPLSIVQRAIMENERKEFDHTWCVFDRDLVLETPKKFKEAKKLAKEQNPSFFLAESFPCFELWFLFHYEYTTKVYENYSQLETDLCYHISDYCKKQDYLKKKNLYLFLKDKMSTAIQNCEKLDEYNKKHRIVKGSRCDIYKIIKAIKKLNL